MLTAEARARESAWALARRARAWTLAYNGMAIAARMPMMATTIINSMSVKPRWLPSILRFQNLCICLLLETGLLSGGQLLLEERHAGSVPRPSMLRKSRGEGWQVVHFKSLRALGLCKPHNNLTSRTGRTVTGGIPVSASDTSANTPDVLRR